MKGKNKPTKQVVYVEWLESERGWGIRPDGCSLHLTESDYHQYEKEYWAGMPKAVPDEYSRPASGPSLAFVSTKLYNQIQKSKNGLRLWQFEESKLKSSKDLVERL